MCWNCRGKTVDGEFFSPQYPQQLLQYLSWQFWCRTISIVFNLLRDIKKQTKNNNCAMFVQYGYFVSNRCNWAEKIADMHWEIGIGLYVGEMRIMTIVFLLWLLDAPTRGGKQKMRKLLFNSVENRFEFNLQICVYSTEDRSRVLVRLNGDSMACGN